MTINNKSAFTSATALVNAITDKIVFKIRHRWAIFCNNRQNSFARFLFIL